MKFKTCQHNQQGGRIMNSDNKLFFDPKIEGLYSLLAKDEVERGDDRGFEYYQESGLNIVAYGPSGVGKTILALQMAVAAKEAKYHVLYFTKDTPAIVLIRRIEEVFGFFRADPPDEKASASDGKNLSEDSIFLFSPTEEKTEENLTLVKSAINSGNGFLAFADFNEMGGVSSWADRYQNTSSPFDALGHLQPNLRSLFDKLQAMENAVANSKGLFVVCDSLRPEIVEEHLRYQPLFRSARPGNEGSNNQKLGPGVFLFIMEGAEMPQSLSVAFPPDVQIRMAFRDEHHGIRSRILQLMKTRYQKSLDEETPFIILDKKEAKKYATYRPIKIPDGTSTAESETEKASELDVDRRIPGITVMPPVAQEQNARNPDHGKCGEPNAKLNHVVKFGVEGIGGLTQDGNLAGGGCTLLVTQNRCGSMVLGLHYLLAQIGEASNKWRKQPPTKNGNPASKEPKDLIPRSVLFISLSGEIDDVVHNVWRYPKLRDALKFSNSRDVNFEELWKNIDKQLQGEMLCYGAEEGLPHCDRFYSVALAHGGIILEQAHGSNNSPENGNHCQPYFFVYVPAFRWVTPDEALDGIARLLRFHRCKVGDKGCRGCYRVDRVVLDRVGRLQSRWPLVKEHEVFVSGLAGLCRQSHAELMIIDDTAETAAQSGIFKSRWVGIAQNIIQLRRTSFHGTEAMTIELVRAAGRVSVTKRPYETTILSSGKDNRDSEMRVEDNFRGYTGLFTGEPRRCKLLVELSYDEKGTPLYHELVTAKQNIEASMDDIEVRLMDSREWTGINSAYHDLSAASRDACHIVAIDCVWMESLIEAEILHPFEPDELCKVLPNHVRQSVVEELINEIKKLVGEKKRKCMNAIKDHVRLKTPNGLDEAFKKPSEIYSKFPADDIAELEKVIIRVVGSESIGKAFKKQYVTQSLAVALTNRKHKNQGKGSIYEELRYAIPMRHNWGVLAVARPDPEQVKHVFEKIWEHLAKTNKNDGNGPSSSNKNDPKNSMVVHLLTHHELGNGENDVASKVWQALWGNDNEAKSNMITWKDLAEFRIKYWHPFWQGGWVEHALSSISPTEGEAADLWTILFPRIDFFGIATGSPESVVSFFLELLLAKAPFNNIFEPINVNSTSTESSQLAKLYRFKNDNSSTSSGIAETLLLFCALLSKTPRRRIAIGALSGHHDIGAIRARRLMGTADPSRSPFADWPAQIALFSREWLSTVPDLLPRYDIRHSIRIMELPKASPENDAGKTYWKEIGFNDEPPVGPTVGGPWYLGILRGGNADLGTDVMKDILAPEHEMQSLLSGSAGPVSKKYYPEESGSGEKKMGGRHLPYMETIKKACDPKAKDQNAVFPFDRNQIVNYLEVSPILYNMIRRVMDMEFGEESTLLNYLKKFEENDQLFKQVRATVEVALQSIFRAQGRAPTQRGGR